MKTSDTLNTRIRQYLMKNQKKLDGKELNSFVDENGSMLNLIRKPVKRTINYHFDYLTAVRTRTPTAPIRNRWVRDVRGYATAMNNFDKRTGEDVFLIENDFSISVKTQDQYKETLLELNELYENRLSEKIKGMKSSEKDKYFDDLQSDRDFIRSYFEYEKYQERERNHDDSESPTEELAPKKSAQKEHIEYADTVDKSLRIPREKSFEKLFARVTEGHEEGQTNSKDKEIFNTKKKNGRPHEEL